MIEERKPRELRFGRHYFFYSLLAISIAYLFFELTSISSWTLTADEFVFARHLYDYTFHLPYRDFAPFKPVIGLYLLSIPLFFSHALLDPLFYIKDEIAVINIICMITASYWATRFFDRRAVLLVLLALIANMFFLVYSVELRVDMLTSWFCLFASLSALQHRLKLSGCLLGVAFLMSQKAIWYIAAINGAVMVCWLACARPHYSLRSIVQLNLSLLLVILAYIVCWSTVSSLSDVLYTMFYEGYLQGVCSSYAHVYLLSWRLMLYHGPLLFLLLPFALLSISSAITGFFKNEQRVFIISYTVIALSLFFNFKAQFPYNFVYTSAPFFLLYSQSLSTLFDMKNDRPTHKLFSSHFFLLLSAGYALFLFYIVNRLSLPPIYNLIVIVPLILCGIVDPAWKKRKTLGYVILLIIFIVTGILYPLYQSIRMSHLLNGKYQQAMINAVVQLLEDGGDYVGGVPFLYHKDQPISGLKNLIGPELAYLHRPSDKLRSIMLASVYLAPVSVDNVLMEFDKQPVKVIIMNIRMMSLPRPITNYLYQNYKQYYGSIYLYAPTIAPETRRFSLKFTALYQIEAQQNEKIRIDGKPMKSGQVLRLRHGNHLSDAKQPYQIVIIPRSAQIHFNQVYQQNHFFEMIKDIFI